MWLLKNWKFLTVASGVALIALGLHSLRINHLNASHAREIEKARQEVALQCEKDKKITKEITDDYQDKISSLNRRLSDLRRLQLNCTNVPLANAAPGSYAKTGTGLNAGQDGVNAGALLEFAGEAEQYRIQLIGCQDFVRKTWESRGQPQTGGNVNE